MGNKNLKFVDLFSGLGGFHLAMKNYDGLCVFASDIDKDVNKIYKKNFNLEPHEDIRDISTKEIPGHDILFAGFPCQPFSKGGSQKGFEDIRGTLFFEIARILKDKQPNYILLENVSNLVSHDKGRTYRTIIKTLEKLGYVTPKNPIILSPHNFGIPALRPRVYIPCVHQRLSKGRGFELRFEKDLTEKRTTIDEILKNKRAPQEFYISDYEKSILQMWNEFYLGLNIKTIGFPVWVEEFKSTRKTGEIPQWKENFISKNKVFYKENKEHIDKWLKKHDSLDWCNPSHRKFEWQAGEDIKNIYEGLIQFRPSGVRVKRPDKFSTLVAMNQPQIIGKYLRRLTPDETKKLQSFPEDYILHKNNNIALKQLGNSVNVTVVTKVLDKLLRIA